ncbi:MAG: hypothetical protein V3V78_04385 [Candidatus Woesearchaeota archaeon]
MVIHTDGKRTVAHYGGNGTTATAEPVEQNPEELTGLARTAFNINQRIKEKKEAAQAEPKPEYPTHVIMKGDKLISMEEYKVFLANQYK